MRHEPRLDASSRDGEAVGIGGHRSRQPVVALLVLILAGMGLAERAARSDAMSARRTTG